MFIRQVEMVDIVLRQKHEEVLHTQRQDQQRLRQRLSLVLRHQQEQQWDHQVLLEQRLQIVHIRHLVQVLKQDRLNIQPHGHRLRQQQRSQVLRLRQERRLDHQIHQECRQQMVIQHIRLQELVVLCLQDHQHRLLNQVRQL